LLLKKSPLTPSLKKRGILFQKRAAAKLPIAVPASHCGKYYPDAQFISLKNYQHLSDEKRLDNDSGKPGKKKKSNKASWETF